MATLTATEIQALADSMGVTVEFIEKNASVLLKASGAVVKAGKDDREAEEAARIEAEFELGSDIHKDIRDTIISFTERTGNPIQRGTQYTMFFTARKDGTDSLVVKSKVKHGQTPIWIDNEGKASSDEPSDYKRERETK